MKRKIISIDEKKCNGCGLCVSACHEGAIELINGKAKLVSDEYCDGLGDCLPACPTDAIKIIEREAGEYNEELVQKRMEEKNKKPMPCGCPGTMAKMLQRKDNNENKQNSYEAITNITQEKVESELRQWPVQIKLINPNASYLDNADLLIAADCTAYAYGDFHKNFIKGRITMIGCPKLDDNEYYKDKFVEILNNNNIKSITVVRMSVPCCTGIVNSVKRAMLEANTIVPYNEVIIDTDGSILK